MALDDLPEIDEEFYLRKMEEFTEKRTEITNEISAHLAAKNPYLHSLLLNYAQGNSRPGQLLEAVYSFIYLITEKMKETECDKLDKFWRNL